ncbi:hypothetical protein JR316_0001863 [Psilocybe cubensis]|uniref:Uncharacterized protein n=2 Tax=Psilocybe cubensis TaxID=181762 RepID=A0ACB8HAV0_PSICU|nr:hypothetical protein JR316_0001863 [Psilocybe cubensis]KAH9484959.1 hypothetical protein JR316_0001863 [Psilocybe cubensis]
MSSSPVFHPGLTFATLVVQFAATKGSVIPSFVPRHKGEGENEHSTASGGSSASKPTSSSTPPTNSTLTGSHSSTAASSSSSSSISSFSSSSNTATPTPTPLTLPRPVVRSDITTAGIVGVVVGSVATIGLLIMLVSKCIRRYRKNRGRMKGPRFFRVGSKSPARPQTPVTEMAQTQSSPIITSAVTAGFTTHPFLSRYSQSISTNTTTSLSPLFPAASLERTRSDAGASEGGASSSHTDTLSYVSMSSVPVGNGGSPVLSLLPIISAAAAANAPPPAAHLPEASILHRSLTLHQKSLEEDTKGRDVGRMDTDDIEKEDDGANDPPPSYDA